MIKIFAIISFILCTQLCPLLCPLLCGQLCAQVSAQEQIYFQQDIVSFANNKASGLDPTRWSAVETIDGKTCRRLLKGQKGELILPVWWEEGLRPTEGSNALAEIHYKDTASSPIRVNLFAGLPAEIEIHRIGGLADNQWKTALVPIPWDQIMRFKGREQTSLSLFAPREDDIAIHSIRVRKGNAVVDEKRWAAETRAWVARVQKEKRAHATLPEAQTAELTDAQLKKPAVVYGRTMVDLIYPNSAPQSTDALNTLHMSLAQNEMEGMQFAVYAPEKILTEVRLQCSTLKTADGTSFAGRVELSTIEYSAVSSKSERHPLFPQRLWPMYAVDIPAKKSHGYWFNVESIRGKTQPGIYTGTVTVLSQDAVISTVKIQIQVMAIDLLTMTEAGLHLGGCTPRFLPAHEMKELARYNHNSINLWYSGAWVDKPIRKSATEFDLDFWRWDDFMIHAKSAGIENFIFFLGGNPYGYPDSMQLERDLYRFIYSDNGHIDDARKLWLESTWKADGKVAPEIRDIYTQWIRKFYTHAAIHSWPEPIVTPFDEPAKWTQESWARGKQYRWLKENGKYGFSVVFDKNNKKFMADMKAKSLIPEYICDGGAGPWIKTHFKDCAQIIHTAYPQARIYGSIHHAQDGLPFLDDIEVFCTNAIHQDHALGDKVRAAKGKTFWEYSGANDQRPPAVARYTFGVYFGAFNSRGSLVWAYNWGSRFDTATKGGQWMYAWTTPYSLVRTPYLEGLREGFDDRRYMETLIKIAKEKGREPEVTALLQGIFTEVLSARNEKGRNTVDGFFAQTKDPHKLDVYRQLISNKIIELQNPPINRDDKGDKNHTNDN